MNSAYVSLTVHDSPHRTNHYVNLAQTLSHDHIHLRKLLRPIYRMYIETVLAIHLRPALHSDFHYVGRLDLNHIPHTPELCLYTADWLHAHAKYSPYALPVKQIAFCAHA